MPPKFIFCFLLLSSPQKNHLPVFFDPVLAYSLRITSFSFMISILKPQGREMLLTGVWSLLPMSSWNKIALNSPCRFLYKIT